MMKIPLGILTYRRAEYLDRTLDTFFHVNHACLEVFKPVIVLVQGRDDNTMSVLSKHQDRINRVISLKSNHGCAWGYTLLNQELIEEGTELVMHLQDDWESTEPLTNYLNKDPFSGYDLSYGIFDLFRKRKDVGYIRLRSCRWSKVSNINRVTQKAIKWSMWATNSPKYCRILTGLAHYTFNPTIIRTSVLKKILPVTEELDAMEKYQKLGLLTAQLRANCFMHIGNNRALGDSKRWIR
jgi:glycosyltransferase involved in cell wall biosynthesis